MLASLNGTPFYKQLLLTMKKTLTIWVGLFYTTIAFAQFSDSTNYLISYGSTGVINKTNNTKSYVFTNALKLAVRKKSISLNSATTWIYGWQQDNITNNDFSSTLDFNLYKTLPRFYYWGLAAYDRSYSLKINHRLQAGLGAAYSFVDKEAAYVNISDGILYEASNLTINDSTKSIYHTLRNSLRIRYRFVISDIVILDATHFWQPSLSDAKDYIIKSNTALSVKLRKWLSLTTAANYNRVNRTNRENLLITFGVTVEKYF